MLSGVTVTDFIGAFFVVVVNFVLGIVYFSRLTYRVENIEKEQIHFHDQNLKYETELKEIRDLNSKLDLIISHFMPNEHRCSINKSN